MLCTHMPDWSLQAVIVGQAKAADVLAIPTCQDCALTLSNEIVRATGGLPVVFRRFSFGDSTPPVS